MEETSNISMEGIMKVKDIVSPSTVFFSIIFFTIIFLNLILDIRPVVDYFNLLEQSKLLVLVPLSLLVPVGLFLFDRVRYKRMVDEKVELFQTTVRTVQDIVQDSHARTQMLIVEMEEAKVDKEIVNSATEIFDRSTTLLNGLYNIDPLTAKIKDTGGIVKMFDINGQKNSIKYSTEE